jgi:tRNA (guanine37-N1)-methyltransferase
MRFDIITIFPGIFQGVFQEGILRRAQEAGLISIAVHDLRDYTSDRHRTTDDVPYGGGGGMVMKPEPIFAALEGVLGEDGGRQGARVVLLSPQGRLFDQRVAAELADLKQLVLICGRYEGVDERVREHLVDDEISIGDYVLSGGEIPAMVVVEAVGRLIPGVLGDPGAAYEDSHSQGLLEHPHYTRPSLFRGWAVPEVLLSGDHARIARWRRREALRRTFQRRPDLLARAQLSEQDEELLRELGIC